MKTLLLFFLILFSVSTCFLLLRLAVGDYPFQQKIHRWMDVLVVVARFGIIGWIAWLLFGGAA